LLKKLLLWTAQDTKNRIILGFW